MSISTPITRDRGPKNRLPALLWAMVLLVSSFIACEDHSTSGDASLDAGRSIGDPTGRHADAADAVAEVDTGADAGLRPEDTGVIYPDGAPDGFIIDEPLTLNSLIPNIGQSTGGTRVRVIGTGFFEGVVILLGNQPCAALEIESTNHAWCTAPASPAGTVDVRVEYSVPNADPPWILHDTIEEGFTFFDGLAITEIEPDRGPLRGGVQVAITGRGLLETTGLEIGGARALGVSLREDGALVGLAPAGTAGPADVTVVNQAFNDRSTLPGGFYYFEDLALDELAPPMGPLEGGNVVHLIGTGLVTESRVSFANQGADVAESNDENTRLQVRAPRGAASGPVEVSVDNDNGQLAQAGAYVYFDAAAERFEVSGFVPTAGPVDGGNTVHVAGAGFEPGAHLDVDGRIVECNRIDSHQLACRMPPGPLGAVDLTVISGDNRRSYPGGYTYFERISLVAIVPDRGAVSGGTIVTAMGAGFSNDVAIDVGGVALSEVEVIDETTLVGRTPPNRVGVVDVNLSTPHSRARLPGGFTYFDPTNQFGGVWGEPIEGAINVTVFHGTTGQRLDEVAVLALANGGEIAIEGITDPRGQVTLSTPDLRGPAKITAAKEGFEVTTIEDVEVENVTIYLSPNDGDGDPPPGITPPVVRGVVAGLDLLPKPVNERYVNAIMVEASHSGPHNRNNTLAALTGANPPPAAILLEDGPFAITVRPGELAIVATAVEMERAVLAAYDASEIPYTDLRASINPLAMGLRRFISASPGDQINGIGVEIDHPMDLTIPVDLDNPPAGGEFGPQVYGVLARLNLGAEGYWELDTQGASLDALLTLPNMPRLDGWDADLSYFFVGIAQSPTRETNFQPWAVTVEDTRDVEAGVLITPFVGTPFFHTPSNGGDLGLDRHVSWGVHEGIDGPITMPSANLVTVEEPAMGPPKPLWRYVTPSQITEFDMPVLPEAAGAAGLGGGVMFLTVYPFHIGMDLDFDEFTYDDIAQYSWKAWAVSEVIQFRQ